jgi:hypothetical protein
MSNKSQEMFYSYRISFAPRTYPRPNHRFLSSLSLTILFIVSSSYICQGLGHVVLGYRAEKQDNPSHLLSLRCIVQSGRQSWFSKDRKKKKEASQTHLG